MEWRNVQNYYQWKEHTSSSIAAIATGKTFTEMVTNIYVHKLKFSTRVIIYRYLLCEVDSSQEVFCEGGKTYDDTIQECVHESSTCGGYLSLVIPDKVLQRRDQQGYLFFLLVT